MRKYFYLLIAAFSFSAYCSSQILTVTAVDEGTVNCTTTLTVTLTNGPAAETANIVVDWGEPPAFNPVQPDYPNTQVVNAAPNETVTLTFIRQYYKYGTFTANVLVNNITSQSNPAYTEFPVTVPAGLDCGRTQVYTMKKDWFASIPGSEEIHFDNVPYDFTDENGLVTTIFPDSYNMYRGIDVNHSYTLHVNAAWLAQQNLMQLPPVAPLSTPVLTFDNDYQGMFDTSTQVYSVTYELECDVDCGVAAILVRDIQDMPYYNLPLEFTDANGLATIVFPDSLQYYRGINVHNGNYTVRVPAAWLTLNGFEQLWDVELSFGPEVANMGNYEEIYIKPVNSIMGYITTISENAVTTYSNVPYDFTGENGVTTTIYPYPANDIYAIPGVVSGNEIFTAKINAGWLADNGRTQVTPDLNMNFQGANPDDLFQHEVQVNCSTAVAIPDFSLAYAYTLSFIAPLESGTIVLKACNYSCHDTSDAHVSITFPADVLPVTTGLTNAVFSGNVLSFDMAGLHGCSEVEIPCTFPGNTPAFTIFQFDIAISDLAGTETDLTNNNINLLVPVMNSYDPNIKKNNKPAAINPDEAEVLQYEVHFQNEGNFSAYKVVIEDTISALMDLSTFRLLDSKHPVTFSINPANRLVTFTFKNIMLTPKTEDEEGSKGYVVYSIRENEGLPLWSDIQNTAYIYFDFNPAIVTNTTSNINSIVGIDEQAESLASLYPNPAGDIIHIQAEGLKSVQVIDFTGKCIIHSGADNEISTSLLADGIYLVKITTSKGMITKKLVIGK